ncbi:hypothetical protein FQR65_LT08007 [Abscondita terminalis]|nr:hypothetical protein FQR65_LT08007 [Abscondita terminalis]
MDGAHQHPDAGAPKPSAWTSCCGQRGSKSRTATGNPGQPCLPIRPGRQHHAIDSELGKTDYGYDQLDRLTQAAPDQNLQTLGLPQEQYSYDAVGNRTSSAHQPGVWSYNGDNQLTGYPYCALQRRRTEHSKGYGVPIRSGRRSQRSAIDEQGTSVHYLHTDHLGTPMLGTDKQGAIAWKAVREAFGATEHCKARWR